MKNKRTVLAVLLILFISWFSYKGYDTNFFQSIHPALKHSINFCLLIAVAFTGFYSLIKVSEKWILAIWIFTYCFVILLLVVVGITDLIHHIKNNLIRDSIVPFRMFFTSPLPLLILLVIKEMLHKDTTKKTDYNKS